MHGGERKTKKKKKKTRDGGNREERGQKKGASQIWGAPDFVSCGLSMAPNEEAHLRAAPCRKPKPWP